jgi:hypothetical protein
LSVDRHLTAILEPVVVLQYVWLRVLKGPIAMGLSMRGRHGVNRTCKRSVSRTVARFPRYQVM